MSEETEIKWPYGYPDWANYIFVSRGKLIWSTNEPRITECASWGSLFVEYPEEGMTGEVPAAWYIWDWPVADKTFILKRNP